MKQRSKIKIWKWNTNQKKLSCRFLSFFSFFSTKRLTLSKEQAQATLRRTLNEAEKNHLATGNYKVFLFLIIFMVFSKFSILLHLVTELKTKIQKIKEKSTIKLAGFLIHLFLCLSLPVQQSRTIKFL
jgi:hypothetical protein